MVESGWARCWGRMMLLPVKEDGVVSWKIWNLCTRLESLDLQAEDECLLQAAGRSLDGPKTLETDVFIIGGGNAAAALAVRLKAVGVDSIIAERNAQVGDNWARRYDCMKFHIPTSFCELPYMKYAAELQSPHLLTKDDLAGQLRKYAAAFQLNVINSAKILSTSFDAASKQWTVSLSTPAGEHTVVSKHLVQATGIGSQKPFVPAIADEGQFGGVSIHSTRYKNGKEMVAQGVKSVVIVGSANTAFDVLEDCHAAGLKTTMVVRSPTYVVPLEYVCDKRSLGAYDFGVELGDRLFQTTPTFVDSQLGRGLFGLLASQEPDRYKALAAAGFPVVDSSHADADLLSNLLERAGGHYVDTDGTKLIAEGKSGVRANVEPVAYTASGLRLSDGSELDADAVIWCTGFADVNVRETSAEILGGNAEARDIASRLDATWGLDAEGEIRGMWKRHLDVENFWVMGGFTSQHRWHSRTLALQIKAAIEGILPPAYRATPQPPDRKGVHE
ncbi:putative flavoprotein involved in k+ transport [Diaporthe ampelina]|uniref:Putative flavoprotein involved in k+ transport n=1 Tax=Diaporthe ampelina TaxID=1214573 RepID=A0A0G2HPC2_9PEZI|nr:putative flavoprotein involved in k+ transport [Diaporthe ampelina]